MREQVQPDLVIMGAHGHGGLKDLIFGNTINPVRHDLDIPMLIVRPGKGNRDRGSGVRVFAAGTQGIPAAPKSLATLTPNPYSLFL